MNSKPYPPSNALPGPGHHELYLPRSYAGGTQSAGVTALSPDPGWSLEETLRILRKHLSLVTICLATGAALSVAYLLVATRLYSSTAILRFGTASKSADSGDIRQLLGESEDQRIENTQIELLGSLGTADFVIREGQLRQKLRDFFDIEDKPQQNEVYDQGSNQESYDTTTVTSEDSSAELSNGSPHSWYSNSFKLLKRYRKLVDISPIEDTALVALTLTTSDPDLSLLLAENHSKQFIRLLQVQKAAELANTLEFLTEQERSLSSKVTKAEQRLGEYAEAQGLLAMESGQNLFVRSISETTASLGKTVAERIRLESTLEALEKGEAKAFDGLVVNSASIADQLDLARSEYATLSERFTPEYPRLRELVARITSLELALKSRKNQALQSVKNSLDGTIIAEQKLREEIARKNEELNLASKRLVTYNLLKREYDSVKDLHQNILRLLKEAQVRAASQSTNVTIAEHPLKADSPSSPRRALVLVIGIMLGIVVGVISAVIRELLDTTVKTTEELLANYSLPILGAIPSFKTSTYNTPPEGSWNASVGSELSVKGSFQQHYPLPTVREPLGDVSESFRALRTAILYSGTISTRKTIMVTSSCAEEGKSTTAANLAVAFAQAGYKTLLVEADLRRPSLAPRFGFSSNGVGLSDYLAGHVDLGSIAKPTNVPNLELITSGELSPNPAELIGSEPMRRLLENLSSNHFDHIILDTTPILPVSDALILSRMVEGIILVVRSGKTERQLLKQCTSRLRALGAPLLGTVMVDANQGGERLNTEDYAPRSMPSSIDADAA
jgi:succinoglycan biosynthesis transport protein ExoP